MLELISAGCTLFFVYMGYHGTCHGHPWGATVSLRQPMGMHDLLFRHHGNPRRGCGIALVLRLDAMNHHGFHGFSWGFVGFMARHGHATASMHDREV